MAGRLKKEPDFFLNYHNSGSFCFWLLLKREISDKPLLNLHHIYLSSIYWLPLKAFPHLYYLLGNPFLWTPACTVHTRTECWSDEVMSATLRSGRPVEFKLRVQVSLPSQAFFFQSWWQWPACAGRKTGTVTPWRLKPANAASVCSTGRAAASHRETPAWWLKFTGFAFPL